jgi:hypothetical protein
MIGGHGMELGVAEESFSHNLSLDSRKSAVQDPLPFAISGE